MLTTIAAITVTVVLAVCAVAIWIDARGLKAE
jgi:hypothetical protein